MNKYELPFFGEVEMNSLKDYYCANAQFGRRKTSLDLNFTQSSVDESTMNAIKRFLENIEDIDKENKKQWIKDFNEEGETADYI
ncbi:hypothetical protein, partial [Xanthovirga aplysinae]|uniref:hypothetical protein n=1 Tax=Xanthovirga aplysinae TaxID=2529853 RepID=UPI001CA445E5